MTIKRTAIYFSSGYSIGQCCKDILSRVTLRKEPLNITYFLDAPTEEVFETSDDILRKTTREYFSKNSFIPAITTVPQPPLDANLVAEVTYLEDDAKVTSHGDYLIVEQGKEKELITDGLRYHGKGDTGVHAEKIFSRLKEIFSKEGFAVNDIVRQWNYIQDITAYTNGKQNYQLFNDARSTFYSGANWSDGYPAATGIGCDAGVVTVTVHAVIGNHGIPIDNPLQIPAHRYSTDVLDKGENAIRTTPKFERARMCGDVVFVSGTSAIKGESSEISIDPSVQADSAMDVLGGLLSPSNLYGKAFSFENLRVYVKRPEDYKAIRRIVGRNYPGIPTIYLSAGVCRPELLLELEGIGHCQEVLEPVPVLD